MNRLQYLVLVISGLLISIGVNLTLLGSASSSLIDNPLKGDVRLALISDLNGPYGSTEYEPEVDLGIKLMSVWQPDLVICGGDMIAAQDTTLSESQIRAMWQSFDDHVAAPLRLAKLPYSFTLGNHDASGALSSNQTYLFERDRNLAREYWQNLDHRPKLDFIDSHHFPFYYTFQLRDIFFLVWDSSTSYLPPDQLAWVEKSLASDQAQSAKMRIVVGHLPLYAVAIGRDKPGEVMANPEQLRELLERYQVHTYISGHHHAYYPGRQGKLQLLHLGILGSGPRSLLSGNQSPWKALTILDINFDNPELTTDHTYNMTTLTITDLTTLPPSLTGHNGTIIRRDLSF